MTRHERWVKWYERGHSIKKIAQHEGVTYQAVRNTLLKKNVVLRHRAVNPEQIRRKYKYELQPHMIPVAAYLAGMVDGDGHIRTAGAGSATRAELTITNSYLPMLEWAAEKTGVQAYSRVSRYGGGEGVKRKGAVCADDCWAEHVHQRKSVHRWIVRGERALIVLKGIEPFLQEKRGRALEVIGIQEALNAVRWVEQTNEEMFKLGWLS